MGKRPLGFLIACIYILALSGISGAQQSQPPDKGIRKLEQGKPFEREISGTEVHSYHVTLSKGWFLRIVVEPRGMALLMKVFGPDGLDLSEIESLSGWWEPKSATVEAKTSGTYRLDIRALDKEAKPGSYEVRIEELFTAEQYIAHVAAERDRLESVMSWLARDATPLRTVEAGQGFEDLQPLKNLIGSAHLVALGEATHGTREFFQLKHRMLEFLVKEMGFTVFGIEATMPEAFDINEYVLTGKGDPAKALAGLYFWFWDTEEILEMIKWMRRYNADPDHSKKVKFYGFDMMFAPRAIKVALGYLHKIDPAQAEAFEKTFALLANPFTSPDFDRLSKEKKEAAAASASAIIRLLDEHKPDDLCRGSSIEWSVARQHARIIEQIIEGSLIDAAIDTDRFEAHRDSSMAENVRWILDHEGPGTKMVIWAHNGHVANDTTGVYKSMGCHLRKIFGHEMVVFGFAFNQGSFQALELPWPSERGAHSFTVNPAPDGTLDATLAAAGLKIATINLHALPKEGSVAEWFREAQLTRSLGLPYSEKDASRYFLGQKVTRLYDALFFVENTTAARLNAGGQRPGEQRLQTPANLDFEDGGPGKPPADWMVPKQLPDFDFAVTTSEDNPRTGKRCAMISRLPGRHYGETYGSLSQRIDAKAYSGNKIKLHAAVRAEVAGSSSRAYLWLRVMKKGFGLQAWVFYDNMADRPITNSEWCNYEILGEVLPDAETIDYGLALVGDGRAWLDSVSVEVIKK